MLRWQSGTEFEKLNNRLCELGVSGSIVVSKTEGVGSIPTVHAE